MSIRIHTIAKKIGMENKELVELLKSRGFTIKNASSTIDNISGESIIEEFTKKNEDAAPKEDQEAAPKKKVKKAIKLPSGPIVKSAKDVEDEKKAKEEAKKKAAEPEKKEVEAPKEEVKEEAPKKAPESKAPPSMAPPAPSGPAKLSPPPASSAPKSMAPPVATPPPAASAPKSKAPTAVVAPAPSAPKSVAPPAAASKAVETKAPPAVNAPPAPGGKAPTLAPPAGGMAPPAIPAATPETEEVSEGPQETPSDDLVTINVKPPIVVREFATLLGLKPFKLISELMEMGIFASMNQTLEDEVAINVALNHGFLLEISRRGIKSAKAKEAEVEVDESDLLEPRPPVVCILGHVDHGKTTLLDTIRKANVVSGEAGGITQHIGAYQIVHNDQPITFIDTPGHAAFSKMRERGASLTDVAILVVAADDGFMPQTDEALKFAKREQVSIIVAINKIDAKGANVDRVKQQMQERGIAPEDWGGDTVTVGVSALNGDNIDELIDMILLQSEMMELQGIPTGDAEGIVVESQMEQGKGATATVIVQRGELKPGNAIISGTSSCRLRAMNDENGKQMKKALPSQPVKLMGWSMAPDAGSKFKVVKNEKVAKKMALEAIDEEKKLTNEILSNMDTKPAPGADPLATLFNAINASQLQSFRIVIKGDVRGSLEALAGVLQEIKSDKVKLEIIRMGVGQVNKSDIQLASAANASIIAFNIGLENGVRGIAKHNSVDIFQHNIIYELIDIVKDCMADLLEPELIEKKVGAAEIRQIFPLGKGKYVAGCMITEGKIIRDQKARVMRGKELMHESTVDTLRRFKDDVNEVRAGYECGIRVDGFDAYEEGDVIECIDIEKKRPKL